MPEASRGSRRQEEPSFQAAEGTWLCQLLAGPVKLPVALWPPAVAGVFLLSSATQLWSFVYVIRKGPSWTEMTSTDTRESSGISLTGEKGSLLRMCCGRRLGHGLLCKVLDSRRKSLSLIFRTHVNQLGLDIHFHLSTGKTEQDYSWGSQASQPSDRLKISERPCLR